MSLNALVGGTTGPDGVPTGRFRELFNMSGPFTGQAFQGIQQAAPQLGAEFLDASRGFLGQAGQSGEALQGLLGQSFVNQQLGGLASLLNQNFSENILPQIQGQAVGAGQLGGSRQTQSLLQNAEQFVNRPFMQQAGNILQSDLFNQRQSAAQLGGIMNQGAAIGLQGAGQAFDLGLAPFMSPFAPLQAQANLLGSMRPSQQSTTGILPATGAFFGGVGEL